MGTLDIKYVNGGAVAFTLNGELYYLKTGPDLPQLFDSNLRRLHIPNMDNWLQAQSQQRYSYRGLQDMMKAFAAGLKHSYVGRDFIAVCRHIFDTCRDAILKSAHTPYFARTYRLELLEPKAIRALIKKLSNEFSDYRQNLGEERFFNYLCRIWQVCQLRDETSIVVVEKLIGRLERVPQEPVYKDSEDEEAARIMAVNKVITSEVPRFKGIEPKIVETVDQIQRSPMLN
jgi:hypothetical protein